MVIMLIMVDDGDNGGNGDGDGDGDGPGDGGRPSAVGHLWSWLVSWLVVVVGRSSVVARCSGLFPLARQLEGGRRIIII